MFYPNSIGLVGVSTDTKFLENSDLDIQFFYDNDDAGNIKTEQKIKSGYRVFLWKKLLTSIVDKKKTNEPDKHLFRLNKIKDLGKLNELVPNSYEKLKLNSYFSKDMYDLIWIPKKLKNEYKDKQNRIQRTN